MQPTWLRLRENPALLSTYLARARVIKAIRAFYGKSIAVHPKLLQQGPTRIAGDFAAFAFTVTLDGGQRIDVIDTFQFDVAGKVVEMRAYFGPINMHGF